MIKLRLVFSYNQKEVLIHDNKNKVLKSCQIDWSCLNRIDRSWCSLWFRNIFWKEHATFSLLTIFACRKLFINANPWIFEMYFYRIPAVSILIKAKQTAETENWMNRKADVYRELGCNLRTESKQVNQRKSDLQGRYFSGKFWMEELVVTHFVTTNSVRQHKAVGKRVTGGQSAPLPRPWYFLGWI